MEEHTCCRMITPKERWGSYHKYPCGKKAKVERNGKWYCGVHDPERLQAIRDKNEEQWRKDRDQAELIRCTWRKGKIGAPGWYVMEWKDGQLDTVYKTDCLRSDLWYFGPIPSIPER